MKTRNGKIARLPRDIREQLNRRMEDGEPGNRLVEWLNALPDTQRVLAADFGGHQINEQNLSGWKQGGFQEWQKQQEKRELVRQLADEAGELHDDADGLEVSNHLAAVLSAELAESARELLSTITDPTERWARLQELLRELARVRREDCRAGRLQIERERRAQERSKEEKDEAWRKQHALSNRIFQRSYMGSLFKEPDLLSQARGLECAQSLLLEEDNLRSGSSGQPDQSKPDQSESR